MTKIVFFDVDGTLLNEEKQLPESTKAAVRLLQENGIYVAISTGRAPFMLEALCKELDIRSYVCFNGQYVVFEGEAVYTKPLPQESLERLIADATEHDHPIVFSAVDEMRVNLPDHNSVHQGMNSLKLGYPKVDASFYKGSEIYQCLLFCTEEYDNYYTEKFPQYRFLRWHESSVDVCPANGSKAVGIREAIRKLGFSMEDTYAFGDGLNDIDMLQEVGCGVAMGNARPEVKEVADYITSHVDEDGIWNALKHFKLI